MSASDTEGRKEILNLVVQEYYRSTPRDPHENQLDEYDENALLFVARKDTEAFCKFAKHHLLLAVYNQRLRKIQFPRSENWNRMWSVNLWSWMAQVSITWVSDFPNTLDPNTSIDVALQILPAIRLEIHHSKKCWFLFNNDGFLLRTGTPKNGYLEQLKKLYHLFPPKYSAPFNIWLAAISALFQIFHFKLPVDEIRLDFDASDEKMLVNAWDARSIDFHPGNHWRQESLGGEWINLRYPIPIIYQRTVRQVCDAINLAVILHTTVLGLTRGKIDEWIGYDWKKFDAKMNFEFIFNDAWDKWVSCNFDDGILQAELLLRPEEPSYLSIKCEDFVLCRTNLTETCKTPQISITSSWVKYQERLATSRETPSFISLAPMDKMLFFVGWTMLTAVELYFSWFSGSPKKITCEEDVFDCTTLASKCKERKEVEKFISFYLPKDLATLIVQYSHRLDSPPLAEEFLRTIKHLH